MLGEENDMKKDTDFASYSECKLHDPLELVALLR